jgi:hypothetical protein
MTAEATTYAAVLLLLTVVALLGAAVSSRIDPMVALQYE